MSTKKRKALGRGLEDLFSATGSDVPEDTTGIHGQEEEIPVSKIVVNPFQPRTDFDDTAIVELAESIRHQGLIQPIVVRRSGEVYQIVSGERRFRAMGRLGWERIPAIIRTSISDQKMLEIAIVENVQRVDLNDIEKGISYKRLLEECGLSHKELSERIGKSRSAITNCMRLLKLPAFVQDLVRKSEISMGHARALLSLEHAEEQVALAKEIVEKGLSVRAVEERVAANKQKPTPAKRSASALTETATHCVEQWKEAFGSSVSLKELSQGRVAVQVVFSSQEEFARSSQQITKASSHEK
ncbi:ParB/RepB/Spo0J family partition protein [Chitinivibrio alkaliphilus]|uniref:ParB-like partition protein n=1 Tax=Chitinivibrio alkaliphilus ACht1 TaxID=1313304 RepID=U7D5A5_9BACT|nr:ParB/RepB/Spo0J family partition protein [Chitinivibrio alkaliphilus]ERP31128.1 parB-like partition protein [Chitinivibrio alkaliphilus ACht1]